MFLLVSYMFSYHYLCFSVISFHVIAILVLLLLLVNNTYASIYGWFYEQTWNNVISFLTVMR